MWALLSLLQQIGSVWWFLSWQCGLCCWHILGISGRWFGTWKGKDANNYFILSNFQTPECLRLLELLSQSRNFSLSMSQSQQLSTGPCLHPNSLYPPPYHSEIIFPIAISSVCRYSKGSGLSLSFLTKILCSCFVLAVTYETKGKFLMHMFRCPDADIANSTLFFFPFVCGLHFRLHSLVLSSAYIRITNVHTSCYTVWSPRHALATVEAHVWPQTSPCGICG
jgi:hypothetical protein